MYLYIYYNRIKEDIPYNLIAMKVASEKLSQKLLYDSSNKIYSTTATNYSNINNNIVESGNNLSSNDIFKSIKIRQSVVWGEDETLGMYIGE